MDPLTPQEIRRSFANCSRGEASRAVLPDLAEVSWDRLDFLGWEDPSGSPKGWLVLPGPDSPVGLVLRRTPRGGGGRSAMCDLCATPHSGDAVALTVATKAGPAGRKGDSTGLHVCRDLACSLYVRGLRTPTAARLRETLSQGAMVARLRRNTEAYVAKVLADPGWRAAWPEESGAEGEGYAAWPAQA